MASLGVRGVVVIRGHDVLLFQCAVNQGCNVYKNTTVFYLTGHTQHLLFISLPEFDAQTVRLITARIYFDLLFDICTENTKHVINRTLLTLQDVQLQGINVKSSVYVQHHIPSRPAVLINTL